MNRDDTYLCLCNILLYLLLAWLNIACNSAEEGVLYIGVQILCVFVCFKQIK